MNDLINKAKAIRNQAYVPYSKFKVGAAVLMASGNIYTGCNIENGSYSLTCCAERVAIFKAVSNGEQQFKKIVIIADTEEPVSPCGACRQVMSEFFHKETVIYLMNMNEDVLKMSLDQLLPYSFSFHH